MNVNQSKVIVCKRSESEGRIETHQLKYFSSFLCKYGNMEGEVRKEAVRGRKEQWNLRHESQ